jgi:hypothetical protein
VASASLRLSPVKSRMSSPTAFAGQKPDHRLRIEPTLVDDALQHLLRVLVELARGDTWASSWRIAGKRPFSSQVWKNGVHRCTAPIPRLIGAEHAGAGEAGFWRM